MASPTALFWDYENVPLPASVMAADASKAILDALAPHGIRIVDRKVYYDATAGGPGEELCLNGFSLVHTPRRGQKESVDKKMIVDMLGFAWERSVSERDGIKPCVVLITGDGDYAYAMNKLREGGVKVILIHGESTRLANDLIATADVHMSLLGGILLQRRKSATTDNARSLYRIVLQEFAKDNSKAENGWLMANEVAMIFHKKVGPGATKSKSLYQEAREMAVTQGWLEKGRRRFSGEGKGQIVATRSSNSDEFSKEDFLRVVSVQPGPPSALSSPHTSTKSTATTRLFVKNISRDISTFDFIDYLKDEHNITVTQAFEKSWHKTALYRFTHIKLDSSEEVDKIFQLSNDSKLVLNDRCIKVENDRYKASSKSPTYNRGDIEKDVAEGDSDLAFCKIVHLSAVDSWAMLETVERRFHAMSGGGLNHNPTASDDARHRGYIEFTRGTRKQQRLLGMRHLSFSSAECFTAIEDRENTALFVRLTERGNQYLKQNDIVQDDTPFCCNRKTGTLHIFISNLPVSITVLQLVQFLQDKHSFGVKKACIDPMQPGYTYNTAHVEVVTSHDAGRMLQLAFRKGLVYDKHALAAKADKNVPDWHSYCSTRLYCPPVPVAVCPEESVVPSTLTPDDPVHALQMTGNGYINTLTNQAGNLPNFNANNIGFEETRLLLGNESPSSVADVDLLWSPASC